MATILFWEAATLTPVGALFKTALLDQDNARL
jgi:hypothetical protein